MKTITAQGRALSKATQLILAIALVLGLVPTTTAHADQGTMSVDYGRFLEFRQTDPSTSNYNWADNAMTINGQEVLCTDISAMVVNGASYTSSPMDADTALRWGLYNQYLTSLGWGRLKVLGYLQFMIWTEANADYIAANGVYPNTADFWDVYGRAKSHYNANKAHYVGEGVNWHSPASQSACGVPSVREATGYIDLLKVSAQPSITNGNECYSLAGAVYGVYSDSGCTNEATKLKTNEDGYDKTGALRVGTWYVREITPPKGFAKDDRVYTVTVASGQTSRVNGDKVSDLPQGDPADALLHKFDGEHAYGASNLPQGSASLALAKFKISYYGGYYEADELSGKTPIREWIMQTDEDGYTSIYFGHETFTTKDGATHAYKVSGDEFWLSSAGNVMIPLGTIAITETAPPEGYTLSDPSPVYVQHVVATGHGAAIQGEEVDAYNAPEVPEQVIRGGASILKLDADTGLNSPEGAATLDGAKIAITTENDNPVIVGGREYAKGETVLTLTTIDGAASTADDALPYGHYSYVEVAPPAGYLIDTTVRTLDIVNDGEVVKLDAGRAVSDKVMRGDLALVKVAQHQPATGGSGMLDPLAGVSFDLINDNDNPVTRPDGSLAAKGEIVLTITTDDRGYAETTGGALAYGSYIVHEDASTVPHGYATVEDFRATITQDGQELYYALEDGTGTPIRVVKTDADTGKQIAGYTTFRILDERMQPVTFTRYYPSIVHMTAFVTDATGSCMLPEKLNGGQQYYLQEIGAPEGYVLNGALIPFVPDGDAGYTWGDPLTVTLSDRAQTGVIEIAKTDAETGEIVPLSGIAYDVRAAEDVVTADGTVRALKGDLVASIVSDENGIARTGELHLGRYECVERTAPAPYLINPNPVAVELAYAGQTVEVTRASAVVADAPQKGIVEIAKIDETTGLPIPASAEFRITAIEDVVTPDGTVRAHAGEAVATVRTDENGIAESPELYVARYLIEEAWAPEGYLLADPVEVELSYEGQSVELAHASATVADAPQMGVVGIAKADGETGESLAGAVYEIAAAEDVVTPDGTVRAHAGEVVATMTTDDGGSAISPELHLGIYDVYEVRQPSGMVLDPTRHRVALEYAGQSVELATAHIEATNQPTRIEVVKQRAGDGSPLGGVEFAYWNKADEHAIENATGSGVAAVAIEPSDATEIVAVSLVAAEEIRGVDAGRTGDGSGAMPDETLLHSAGETVASLTQDDEGVYVSGDVPCGGYELVVEFAYNGNPDVVSSVALASFALDGEHPRALYRAIASTGVDDEGKTATTWDAHAVPAFVAADKTTHATTDAEGKLDVKRLPAGTYGFAEFATLPGYVLDATARYLTVADDGTIGGEQVGLLAFANDYTKLSIAKVDAATGDPVTGALLELYAAPAPGTLDADGNLAKYGALYDTWTSEDTPHSIDTIPAGRYVLHEAAPSGKYFPCADMDVVIDGSTADVQLVTIANDYTRVDAVKVDADTGAALPGAALAIVRADGTYVDPREFAIDGGEALEISEIAFNAEGEPTGTAPLGTSDKITWTLKDAWGEIVAEWDGATPPADEVLGALASSGSGNRLEKTVTPSDAAAYCWVSTDGPVRFEGLEPGGYRLVEIACPAGYLAADPVGFDVRATGEVQTVSMADEIDAQAYDKTGTQARQMRDAAPWVALAAAACVVVAVALRRKSPRRKPSVH